MDDIAIKVQNLTKIYKLYDKHIDRLKESLHPFRKKYGKDFYALENINLEIKKGETTGIIGKNGSGKSTLLKIISGVLNPTTGNAVVNGKIAAILELGTGFNMEYTGIENIFFSGTIMGYTREEMETKLDSILAFADIGEFINQPIKIYSSGMFVRLAFALAINVDPDILVIDEALAVGDIRFQQKCFRKINDFKDMGKTILLVSHDVGAVINFCDNAFWLKDSHVFKSGNPNEVCKEYSSYMAFDDLTNVGKNDNTPTEKKSDDNIDAVDWINTENYSSFGKRGAVIKKIAFCLNDFPNKRLDIFEGGVLVRLLMQIKIQEDMLNPIAGFTIKDEYGNSITGLNNFILSKKMGPVKKGENLEINFLFNFPKLKNGKYTISPAIAEGTQDNHIQHHWVHDAVVFQISSKDKAAQLGWYFLIDEASINITNLN